MSSIFDIGLSSLLASKYALTLTAQNIANANEPFYSRREVDFSEAYFNLVGNGVNVADVRRIFDNLANQNLFSSNSDFSKAEKYFQQSRELESLLDGGKASIPSYINESLNALQSLNTNTTSTQSRNLYLFQLQSITNRFNTVSNETNRQQQNINATLQADVGIINDLTGKIALINDKIGASLSPSAPANMSLLDERDKLMNSLAKYIDYNSNVDNRGMVNIEFGNGIPLIVGNHASSLRTIPTINNPFQFDIALEDNGSQMTVTRFISGGEIAGLFSFQNNALQDAQNALGRLALVLAQKINQQNQLGVDLNGNLGANIFNDINQLNLTIDRVSGYSSNQGSGSMSVLIQDASQLTTSDYILQFDTPSQYTLIRKSDQSVMSTGDASSLPLNINVDGFSLQIASGTFVAGDKFTISPTKNAAAQFQLTMIDSSKLALGFPVTASSAQQNTGNGLINITAITDTTTNAFATPLQLNPPIRIEFTSTTTYRLVNLNDNSVIEDNIPYDPASITPVFPTSMGFDPGYRVSLSGSIQAGDAFEIDYNINGSGDNRNGLLLADLYKQGIVQNNTLNFDQSYYALSGDISSKTNVGKLILDTSEIIKNQAENRREQISGVSLEEETMNMARFQQFYQASAEILDVSKKMFDTVIGLARS